MTEKTITAGVTILLAIISVAVVALLVSRSAQTGGLLTAISNGFGKVLCTALSPIGVTCAGSSNPIESVTSNITFGT